MGATGALSMMQGTQAINSFAGGYAQSKAREAQGAYQEGIYNTNADESALQAQDALDRGNKTAAEQTSKTGRFIGTQRAGLAAQGIDVNSGSALDVQDSSRFMGELDALTIKNNAMREAYGFKSQELEYRSRARMARQSADFDSGNTLLTGGMAAAGYGAKAVYYGRGGKPFGS